MTGARVVGMTGVAIAAIGAIEEIVATAEATGEATAEETAEATGAGGDLSAAHMAVRIAGIAGTHHSGGRS